MGSEENHDLWILYSMISMNPDVRSMDYDLELDSRADLQTAENFFKKIQHLLAEIFAAKSELPFAEVQWTRESWALASVSVAANI